MCGILMVMKKKNVPIIFFALVCGIAVTIGIVLYARESVVPREEMRSAEQDLPAPSTDPCAITRETREVRGESLSGVIEPGTQIEVLLGYYACHAPARNDIVIYRYGGDPDPLIKIVRGIPGDVFELKKEGQIWRIMINENVLTTSGGAPYALDDRGYRMLSLYVPDTTPRTITTSTTTNTSTTVTTSITYRTTQIPPNTYLILGNLPNGSTDSTRFGLVDKSDIIGKVERGGL